MATHLLREDAFLSDSVKVSGRLRWWRHFRNRSRIHLRDCRRRIPRNFGLNFSVFLQSRTVRCLHLRRIRRIPHDPVALDSSHVGFPFPLRSSSRLADFPGKTKALRCEKSCRNARNVLTVFFLQEAKKSLLYFKNIKKCSKDANNQIEDELQKLHFDSGKEDSSLTLADLSEIILIKSPPG